MTIAQIADCTIPSANNKKVLTHNTGATRDIITEVLDCFHDDKNQLKAFAPYLKGNSTLQTCNNIWNFWKQNITYKVDADGVQWIKSPAAVWATKFCDCKSFSVAAAATLHCLGINGKFRFTSYGSNKTVPTHVYVVAMDGKKEIIIDCVWTGFNSQKPYSKKWDYNMTKIFRISGPNTEEVMYHPTQKKYAIGELNIDVRDNSTTQAEMDLALDLQGLELEQQYNRRRHSIGSPYDNAYQVDIEAHKAALGSIGLIKSKKKKLAIAIKKNDGKGVNKSQSKLLSKAGVAVKKKRDGLIKRVGKGITKVVKTPARLAAKSALPDSAPFFLYLYITDARVLAAAPEAVKVKRAKAELYKNQLVNKLQMPAKNFDQIVRNGIIRSFGMPAEQVIAKWMKDANFKVGFLGLASQAGAILGKAKDTLKSLFSKFGDNLSTDAEQFSPSPEDWGVIAANPAAAQAFATAQGQGFTAMVQQSSSGAFKSNTTPEADYEERNDFDGLANDTSKWEQTESGWVNRATGETSLNDPRTLENITLTSSRKAAVAENSGSSFLLIGLGALALLSSK